MFRRKKEGHIGRGAKVAADVELDRWTKVGEYSKVSKGCRLGPWTQIGVHSSIGENCTFGNWACVGDRVVMGANVTLGSHTRILDDVIIPDGTIYGDYDVVSASGPEANRRCGYALRTDGELFIVSAQAGWRAEFPKHIAYGDFDCAAEMVGDYMSGKSERLAEYIWWPDKDVESPSPDL